MACHCSNNTRVSHNAIQIPDTHSFIDDLHRKMKKPKWRKRTCKSMDALAHRMPPPRAKRTRSEAFCKPVDFMVGVGLITILTSSTPSFPRVVQPSSVKVLTASLNPLITPTPNSRHPLSSLSPENRMLNHHQGSRVGGVKTVIINEA